MVQPGSVMSKVIIHETNKEYLELLKRFCEANQLVGLRDTSSEVIFDVLDKNIELGAVFIGEEIEAVGIALSIRIHELRHDLPIFLRRQTNTLDDLSEDARKAITGAYTPYEFDEFKKLIDDCIFNTHYPTTLVEGIRTITETGISSLVGDCSIECDHPYLVKDRLIYGEIFSLIPIESSWCRGYMMLQIKESDLTRLVGLKSSAEDLSKPSSKAALINAWFSEFTNMVWGSFRSRFCASDTYEAATIQLPIITNHVERYINFGSEQPHLVFGYQVSSPSLPGGTVTLYQKLIFSLSWNPEDMIDNDKLIEQKVEAGDLEFF
ncbi:MAG: chemotaxis protein CheX [Alteromonadaceae bacterium]|nr:MAG: chemotaxis protein CheX [Alteromonadaceae bacterium]